MYAADAYNQRRVTPRTALAQLGVRIRSGTSGLKDHSAPVD